MIEHTRRRRLLSTTALQAAALCAAGAAQAQSPFARPLGGEVVAGSATISNTPGTTSIDQSSGQAAIDWQSFNVGSRQTVNFQQPSASAVVLNRVAGPDPSAIAGRIDANGQVIITNPSGVVFSRGAQVNAQSLVVSAAGMTNANLMAGRAVFDQAPNPNARIENRGRITVRQAGLAALVAPSVANSGVISARLGRVVLAGATTHTLDLYGDGLVSFDVGSQVRQVPVGLGGRAVDALVTNTGTIIADGGTVELTASAADGVIQKLVDASGTVRADSVGNRTGSIAINGLGGSVVVEGTLLADGDRAGGTVAVGTDLARAQGSGTFPAGTSERTIIAPTARISANARRHGHGGRVTILSTQATDVAGSIEALGGTSGGDGGTIELSGETGFALTGQADVSAPHGMLGRIVIDPTDLTIVANSGTTTAGLTVDANTPNIPYADLQGASASVTASEIEGLTGNIQLQAIRDLTVAAPITLASASGPQNLLLQAGRNLTIDPGVPITASGTIGLVAASPNDFSSYPAGALTVAGTVTSLAGGVALTAGTGGITVTGTVDAQRGDGLLAVVTTGPFVEQGGTASIIAGDLEGEAAGVSLLSRLNQIDDVGRSPLTEGGGFVVTGTLGDFLLSDNVPLTVGSATGTSAVSVQSGNEITLITNQLSLLDAGTNGAIEPVLSAPGGTVTIAPFTAGNGIVVSAGSLGPGLGLTTTELAGVTADVLALGTIGSTAGDITFGTFVDLGSIATLALAATGSVTQTGPLVVDTLKGTAGLVSLTDSGNAIGTLDGFVTTAGSLALDAGSQLTVSAPLVAQNGTGAINLLLNQVQDDVEARSPTPLQLPTGGASLLIAADVDGGRVDLDTTNGTGQVASSGGIEQSAGTISTGTLTGAANFATLSEANAIGTLADFSTEFDLRLNNAGSIQLDGSIGSVFGTIALSASAIDQVGGSISAPELDGASSGPVSLTSRDNTIASLGSFAISGGAPLTLVTSSPSLDFVGTVAGNGSSLAFQADGVAISTGSIAAAITDPGGTVAFEPFTPGLAVELIAGPTADANTLALDQPFLDIVNTGTLVIGGPAAGAITVGHSGDAISLRGLAPELFLDTTGTVGEGTGAIISLGTLGGDTGDATLAGPNSIDVLGPYTAPALALTDATSLEVAGPVSLDSSGTIVSAGPLALAGNVSATGAGTIDLAAASVSQSGGAVIAGTIGGTIGGAADLASPTNMIATIGRFSSLGPLLLGDGAPGLDIAGTLAAPAITLQASGAVFGTGILVAGTLSGSVGGLSLQGTNSLGALGTLASASSIALDDAVPLSVEGPVAAIATLAMADDAFSFAPGGSLAAGTVVLAGLSSAPISFGTLPVTAGTLVLGRAAGGPVTLTGDLALNDVGVLDLLSAGTISQANGAAVSVGTLGASGGAVLLGGANQIATLGSVASAGDLTVNDGVNLREAGPVTASGSAGLTTAGTLTLAGPLTASSLSLTAGGGPIIQTGGAIMAGTLDASGASIDLGGPNRIAAAGTLASLGPILLADDGNLVLTGPVAASLLDLTVTGSLAQVSGRIDAGVLTGSAGGSAEFGTGGTASVGTLAGFSAGSTLTLADAAPLVLSGSLSAPDLAISAPGSITLDGGSIATSGLPPASERGPTPAPPGSFVEVTPGADGRGTFTQLGTTDVLPDGDAPSTLRIGLPADGGTLSLTDLVAPRTTIILGPGDGNASGTIDAGSLLVLDQGGSASLSGTVDQLSGFDAASIAGITPQPDILFELNGCEIASACLPPVTVLSPEASALNIVRPDIEAESLLQSVAGTDKRKAAKTPLLTLDVLDLEIGRDDDAAIQLPNISDRDY